MPRLEPKLSEFGLAFAWLLRRDASSARIANSFGTTAANVRVIAFRAGSVSELETGEPSSKPGLKEPPSAGEVRGVRRTADEVVPTPVRANKLKWLQEQIEETVVQYSSEYRFLDGVAALRALIPHIGYAGDARRIALSALLHQHIAWFFVHSGRSRSAANEAVRARNLWRRAFQESPERGYGERFVQAALIGSQAHLLANRPQQAWGTLEIARDAAESIQAPMGSDHFRQRGVALFQLREFERAANEFKRSAYLMEKLNEAKNPAQLLMTGSRHVHLLRGEPEKAEEILNIATESFGASSLESSMALHWAAATGLLTDSGKASQHATELLESHPLPPSQLGHQATIRKLLTVTPELGLDERLRQAWVRRALYDNAFRNR